MLTQKSRPERWCDLGIYENKLIFERYLQAGQKVKITQNSGGFPFQLLL